MVNPWILLAIPLLPALGALINGVRAFATPLEKKNRAITNLVALGTTGLSAALAVWTVWSYRGAEAVQDVAEPARGRAGRPGCRVRRAARQAPAPSGERASRPGSGRRAARTPLLTRWP